MLDMLYQRDCIIFSFEKFLQTISSPNCIHTLLDIVLYELKILIGLNLYLPIYTIMYRILYNIPLDVLILKNGSVHTYASPCVHS